MNAPTQLTPICPELWAAEHAVAMPGGVVFVSRMTVIRLPERQLLLYSPIPLDAALREALAALGEISFIVAPNGFHHLYARDAKLAFPDAQLWASPALRRKGVELTPDRWLDEHEPSWATIMPTLAIEGAPRLREYVLVHTPSRSLIYADLAFNIQRAPTRMSALALWFAGVSGGRFAQSRLWRVLTRDRVAARASLEAVLAQDFERVIPGHGAIIEHDGPARLREACAWMLSG